MVSLRCLIAALLATTPTTQAFTTRANHAAFLRKKTTKLSMSATANALIIQNKGGGHGELGYQLAKLLETHPKICNITILQDDNCNYEQEPFKSYFTDIPNVTVITAPLAETEYYSIGKEDMQGMLGGRDVRFDYVWDNASKGPDGPSKSLCECAKDWGVKLYTYVSSAGMYKPSPDGPFPMPETTPIKESAGQNQFDTYAIELGLPLVSFRPQYIYGPKANKYSYLDYYFDRLVRDMPIPIPYDGNQLVSLTCSEDVASLLIAPLDNEEKALKQRFFNCGTDQLVTYKDVAYLCAEAAGVDADKVQIKSYDPEKVGKGDFPFRPTNFYVSPDTAKSVLGWKGPDHTLRDDLLNWYYDGYVKRGGLKKDMVQDAEVVLDKDTSSSG